ncbi:hypothetical protein [Actinoplanes philippinensis]|uniref:hypothetical protein n=1 Tax=Actinoplanes philippinensis TaxID=35752 RepID=UPI00340A63FA
MAEIGRHDWSRLRCGCGEPAGHVADMFRTLIRAPEAGDASGVDFDGHLERLGGLYEPAVPAVGVILAALAGEPPAHARADLIFLLAILVSGDSHPDEEARGLHTLGADVRHRAREGIWVILRHVFGPDRDDAGTILEIIDPDAARRAHYARFATSERKPRH